MADDIPKPFMGLYGIPQTSNPTTELPSFLQPPKDPYPYYPEPSTPPESDSPILTGYLLCEHCEERIYENELGVEILVGFLEKGKKSGRLMVKQMNAEFPAATVHDYCCVEFCKEQIVGNSDYNDDPYSDEKYCSGCRERMDD